MHSQTPTCDQHTSLASAKLLASSRHCSITLIRRSVAGLCKDRSPHHTKPVPKTAIGRFRTLFLQQHGIMCLLITLSTFCHYSLADDEVRPLKTSARSEER